MYSPYRIGKAGDNMISLIAERRDWVQEGSWFVPYDKL